MIAGLPVCHLSTKSSPSRPTTVLSDLIMSRIKSREGKGVGGWWTNANPSLTIVLFVTNIKFGSTFWDVASFVTGFSSWARPASAGPNRWNYWAVWRWNKYSKLKPLSFPPQTFLPVLSYNNSNVSRNPRLSAHLRCFRSYSAFRGWISAPSALFSSHRL